MHRVRNGRIGGSRPEAREQGEQFLGKADVAERPFSQTVKNGRFSLGDFVVLVSCALFAEPFCHAAADAFLQGHYDKAALGFTLGVPAGLIGGSFHWWKRRLGTTARKAAVPISLIFGVIGAILAFAYIADPEMYRPATVPVASKSVQQPLGPSGAIRESVYLLNIEFESDNNTLPLAITGIVAQNVDRLRIVVDSSPRFRNAYAAPQTIEIKDFYDQLRGSRIYAQLAYKADKPGPAGSRYFWGDPANNFPIMPLNRIRIVIIGDKGEQDLFYLVVQGLADEPITLVPERDLNWVAEWKDKK